MTTELTTTAGVTAVVIILTTLLLVIAATKLFSRSRTPDSNGGGVVSYIIPDVLSSSSSSSSSSTSKAWKYDVFLSFRGEDTRKTFVDHLYSALHQHNILTYKDDVTLDRGDTIGSALLTAIRESQFAFIIFSENYANSSWCLEELLNIMKCKEDHGQIVIPIFYNVDPSDVRKQNGKFGKAFAELHKLSKNKNQVEPWKKALVDASNIAGWEPKNVANGHEARCMQEIVRDILHKFPYLDSIVDDENLVGMGTRLQRLKSHLRIGSGGVRMVGIWGVGGGGKTTLATSLYMKLKNSGQFHGCCFVENIREESKQQHGLKGLQEKILSTVFQEKMNVESVELGKQEIKDKLCRRNVLIVLDDVDHVEQLEALAGCHNWFGNGSRIVITTRDEQVLESRVDEVCRVSLLSNDEAIPLFKRYAYRDHNPVEDYEKLSLQVISYANHLPLALKILGAFLYGKDKDEWISTLARLKYHPEMGIVEKLKISYDGLTPVEKELFLDIACFFRRWRKDKAMKILDACDFYPAIGVKVLIQKALITDSEDGKFDMHDLVQEMAYYIVRGKHPNYPEKHSRLWRIQDIEEICSRNATTENDRVVAIKYFADVCSSNFIMLVANMKKLRFLQVNTHFIEGPSFLSNELRYMLWHHYPASPFPESFQPMKLALIVMIRSYQKELWMGYKRLPSLKELELSCMWELVRTPAFDGLPCLQKLILDECPSLEEIHPSLGNHSNLVHLSVSGCNKLTRFPAIVKMDELKVLKITKCKALIEFPKIEANLDSLVRLSLNEVGIEVLPSSVGEYCINLILLELEKCSNLRSIEGNFHALKCLENFNVNMHKLGSKIGIGILPQFSRSLKKLNLGCCRLKDGEIPTEIGELSNLQELHLGGNDFTRLDFSLLRLTRLKLLELSVCKNLVELPELPSNLVILKADECHSLEVIRDNIHTNCKWLCQVSIIEGRKNIIGGERLLETMLQGNAIENRCITLQVKELEIHMGFEPRLVRGERCRMQLPDNWYNDFSGFLICAVSKFEFHPIIFMKHLNNDDDDDDDYDGHDGHDGRHDRTWVGYIPFGVLRNTLWWDQSSTAIQMGISSSYEMLGIRVWGFKLVPKRAESSGQMETSVTDYTCGIEIRHDSKHDLHCDFTSSMYYLIRSIR